jgi:hypothetical protein
MPSRRTLLLSSLALALLVPSCLSPTLPPLPPPAQPSLVQPMGEGEVLVEGTIPISEAKVLLLNRDSELIYGALTHDGSYSVLMQARQGDQISLWYSSSGVDSPVVSFNVGAPGNTPDAGR